MSPLQPHHQMLSLQRLLPWLLSVSVVQLVLAVVVIDGQVTTDVPQPSPVFTPLPTSIPTSSQTTTQQDSSKLPTIQTVPTVPSSASSIPTVVCDDVNESLIQIKFDITYDDWLRLDNQDPFSFGGATGYFAPSVHIKYSWMSRKQNDHDEFDFGFGDEDLTDEQIEFATTGEYIKFYDTYDTLLYDQFQASVCVPNNECYFVAIQQMPTQHYQIYVNDEPVGEFREFDQASYIPYYEIHPNFSNENVDDFEAEDFTSSSSPFRPALSSTSTVVYPCFYNSRFNCTVTEVSSRATATDGNGTVNRLNACIPDCDSESEALFEYRFFTGDQITSAGDETWNYRAYDYRLEEISFIDDDTWGRSDDPTSPPIIDDFNNGDDNNDPTASITQTETIVNCESFNCAKTRAMNTLVPFDMILERLCLPKVTKKVQQQQRQQNNATTTTPAVVGTCYRFLVGNSHVSKGIPNDGPDIYVAYNNQVLLHDDLVRMEVVEFGTGCSDILPSSSSSCVEYGLASSSSYSLVEFSMFRQQEDVNNDYLVNDHPEPLTWSISTRYYHDDDTSIPINIYDQSQEYFFVPDDADPSRPQLVSSKYKASIQSMSLYYDRICVPKDSCVVFELDKNDGGPLDQYYDNENLIPSWYEVKYDDVYYRVSDSYFLMTMRSRSEKTMLGPTCGKLPILDGRHIMCDAFGNPSGSTIFEFNFETVSISNSSHLPDQAIEFGCQEFSYNICNPVYGVLTYDDIHFTLYERHYVPLVDSQHRFEFYKYNTKYAMLDCIPLSHDNEACTTPAFRLEANENIDDYELKRDGETIEKVWWPVRYVYNHYTTTPFGRCRENDTPIGSVIAVFAVLAALATVVCFCTKKQVERRHPASSSSPGSVNDRSTTPGPSSATPVATATVVATLMSPSQHTEQPQERMIEMASMTRSSPPVAEATTLPSIGHSSNANGLATNDNAHGGNSNTTHQPSPRPQNQSNSTPPATLSQDLESDDWA